MPPKGYKLSEQAKINIGNASRGRKFSDEARKNIGNGSRGHKLSSEAKKKIGDAQKGKIVSAETKLKQSMAHKGVPRPWAKGKLKKDAAIRQPGYKAKISARYRARKNINGGSHTIGEWETLKAQYNYTCLSCGKREPHIKLTKDHIIPISKGGSNNIENIQPLCQPCNSSKYVKIFSFIEKNEVSING